jgi:hypothetical protein
MINNEEAQQHQSNVVSSNDINESNELSSGDKHLTS